MIFRRRRDIRLPSKILDSPVRLCWRFFWQKALPLSNFTVTGIYTESWLYRGVVIAWTFRVEKSCPGMPREGFSRKITKFFQTFFLWKFWTQVCAYVEQNRFFNFISNFKLRLYFYFLIKSKSLIK